MPSSLCKRLPSILPTVCAHQYGGDVLHRPCLLEFPQDDIMWCIYEGMLRGGDDTYTHTQYKTLVSQIFTQHAQPPTAHSLFLHTQECVPRVSENKTRRTKDESHSTVTASRSTRFEISVLGRTLWGCGSRRREGDQSTNAALTRSRTLPFELSLKVSRDSSRRPVWPKICNRCQLPV